MRHRFRLKALFCICFVLALHIVIFYIWHNKNKFSEKTIPEPNYLQYVSIIPSKPHPPVSSLPSTSQNSKLIRKGMPTNAEKLTDESILVLSHSPPELDLDTLRADVVQKELKRVRPLMGQQQEKNRLKHSVEARVERGANQAAHIDCRTAHAQTGLLAPLFIAADLLGDKGCRF